MLYKHTGVFLSHIVLLHSNASVVHDLIVSVRPCQNLLVVAVSYVGAGL